MKRLITKQFITSFFILTYFLNSHSQGKVAVVGSNNGYPEYLVGTLPISSNNNFHKLKIEIFGGNWYNNNLAENHYYISSRGGLKINQEIHGGEHDNYSLKIYDNGNGYDFVIKIIEHWSSFVVHSWVIDENKSPKENAITDYDSTGKTDITDRIKINLITAVDSEANLGVGTLDTKGYKLAVAGEKGIIAEEVTVKLKSNWPDYVFEKDYNLPPLKEVEQQIKEKGHLKNIPTAKEVKESGVKLGEMNKKLLQKIEELTLYTIAQEKKMVKQQDQMDLLLQRIQKLENK